MNASKSLAIFICLLSISSAFAQSGPSIPTAASQSVNKNEVELRTRFDLHAEREIESAADIAREYLQKYPNGIYASYLKLWLQGFEIATKDYATSLYQRAEFMRKWRRENWRARDDLIFQEMQLNKLKRGVILLTNVLTDVEARAKKHQPLVPPAYILPAPPRPALVAPIDCDETENCFNANAYTLILDPVSPSELKTIVARLTNIERNEPLFGCYDIVVPIDHQINIRCRYVRRIEIEDKTKVSEVISLPESWSERLKDEQISGIWLESGVRVDSEGVPLEPPISYARPIAVQTNTTLYLVSERFDSDVWSHAGHMTSFENKIFDITACSEAASCRDLVMSKYLQKAQTRFAEAPLSVPVIGNRETPPGEIWLGKTKSRSDVLGLPWHEVSRYVIKWYGRDGGTLWDVGSGKGGLGRYIFLQVEQEYTLSPNINGTYRDAVSNGQPRRGNLRSLLLSVSAF